MSRTDTLLIRLLLLAGLICDQTQQPADLNLNLDGVAIFAKRGNQDAVPKPSVKTIKRLPCAPAAFHQCRWEGVQSISRFGSREHLPGLNRQTLGDRRFAGKA